MWRWIFVNLLVFRAISTQPISDHDGRECCPCPKPGPAPDITSLPRSDLMDDCPCRANSLRSDQEGAFARTGGSDQDLAETTGEGAFVRAGAVDDCPCRLRDADSVGAPSVFFPSAVRALWPVVSDKDTKEDAKPLLHPEVGLASSVLETLREATDEEYQEVLARDAVKSVLQAPDVMSDVSSAINTARNIVNVILKPNDSLESRDDSESEASHVQESRCIHPLGRANRLNLQYSPTSVNEIFATTREEPITLLHKNRNIWDMDSSAGASDVQEQIIDGTGNGLQGLKLKSNPSIFNLFPEKNNDVTDEQTKLKSFKDNKKAFRDFKEAVTTESPLNALNRKIDNSLSDLKLKLDNHLQTIKNDNADKLKSVLDNVNSPSTTNFALKQFVPLELTTIKPLPLKSLLNLKDVELIPPVRTSSNDFNKARSKVPEIIPPNHKNKESSIDLFKNFKSVDLGDLITNGLKIGFKNSNNKGGTDNIQPIPKGIFKSGIVDADTSPSEMNVHKIKGSLDCDIKKNSDALMHDQSSLSEAKNTEILEKLPTPPKIKKLHIKNAPAANIKCKTNDVEPPNSNINDLPGNINNLPNTEIIDTIPSPSEINPVEFTDENINATDNSNEVSRNDAEFETANDDIIDGDSSFDSDSTENTREDMNNDELNDEDINDINIPQEFDMEQREQKSDENCLEDSIKHQDSVPETSNSIPNIDMEQREQQSDEICLEDSVKQQGSVPETSNSLPNIDMEQREEQSDENCLEDSVKQQDFVPETRNSLPNIDMEQREQKSDENCLEDSVKQQDSVPETSNNLPNIVQPEDKQQTESISLATNDDSNEACVDENRNEMLNLDNHPETENKFTKINPPSKISSLSSLKENILRKLGKLKQPTDKISMESKKEMNIIGEINDKESDEKENTVSKAVKVVETENIPSKALAIEDLQNMSDKLLDLSAKKDQETFASENIQCSHLPNGDTIPDKIRDPIEEKVDSNSLEDTAVETPQKIDSPEDKENLVDTSNITENIDRSDNSFETKNTCLDFDQKSHFSPIGNNNMKNEMAADSSDPVPKMQHNPSLLHNILHPKPLSIGTSLKGTNLEVKDIFNLKLPSLDHVRDNLASFLEPKDNIRVSNIEDENIADNSNTMSVDASAPTFKSILPSLQPLEDINLDIFQLRPLTLPDPHGLLSQVPSLPRLNLNSYKAKLAVPKGLNLKPMKLESSLGDKNGLLGATLTIGSDKGSLGKGPKLLGGPFSLYNLPTLEELHSNMRENAQNLLHTPLDITGRNIIDDSLRSSQTLTDNLRSHAKNTMKEFHQTLQTRLKDVQQSDLNILADPLKDPQEFLQAVSRTHEDVTDKLKAIHYDLNDRLESIRDRITDQSLLPTLNAPMMRQSSLTFGSEKPSSYSKPQKKLKASSKSKPQTSSRVSSSRSKPAKIKTLKMPAAQSVPVPSTVEAPKLKTIASSSPPPFVLKTPSFQTPQLLTNKKSITDFLQEPVSHFRNSKIPVLGKFKPIENKVKISFGTTTLKPELPRNKPTLAARLNDRPTVPRKPTFSSKITSPVNSGARRLGSKLRPSSDAYEAPSEMVPTKLKAPINAEGTKHKPLLAIPKRPLPELPKPKSLLDKSKPNINDRFTNGHSNGPAFTVDKNLSGSQRESLADSKLGVPKNVDILTSLREAVRARLSNLTPITNDKIVQPDSSVVQPDMLRSASENVESTNVNGLMKENASYTCKMVCTRNN